MKTIYLCKGVGEEGKSHCVMAATSIVAGEHFSDCPECVCPTITVALIRVNDRCPTDEVRNRLLGHLPWLIIGTRGTLAHQIKRAELFAANAYANAAAAAANAAANANANAANAAAAAYAAANANDVWEAEMKKFIDFIEAEIIPVYTTMSVEPEHRIEELVTCEVTDE